MRAGSTSGGGPPQQSHPRLTPTVAPRASAGRSSASAAWGGGCWRAARPALVRLMETRLAECRRHPPARRRHWTSPCDPSSPAMWPPRRRPASRDYRGRRSASAWVRRPQRSDSRARRTWSWVPARCSSPDASPPADINHDRAAGHEGARLVGRDLPPVRPRLNGSRSIALERVPVPPSTDVVSMARMYVSGAVDRSPW